MKSMKFFFWKSSDLISGTGSDELQTETLVRELPKLFEEYQISTLHDINVEILTG